VNGARDQFLSGPRLAGDQHGGIAVGYPADHIDGLADGRACSGDAIEGFALDDGA
jgi:hypothetical protein